MVPEPSQDLGQRKLMTPMVPSHEQPGFFEIWLAGTARNKNTNRISIESTLSKTSLLPTANLVVHSAALRVVRCLLEPPTSHSKVGASIARWLREYFKKHTVIFQGGQVQNNDHLPDQDIGYIFIDILHVFPWQKSHGPNINDALVLELQHATCLGFQSSTFTIQLEEFLQALASLTANWWATKEHGSRWVKGHQRDPKGPTKLVKTASFPRVKQHHLLILGLTIQLVSQSHWCFSNVAAQGGSYVRCHACRSTSDSDASLSSDLRVCWCIAIAVNMVNGQWMVVWLSWFSLSW